MSWLKPEKKEKRPHISEDWKTKVKKRQENKCAKCGTPFSLDIQAQFDHKNALKLGGSHTLRNIWALCANCHVKKTQSDHAKIAKLRAREKKKKREESLLQGVLLKPKTREKKKKREESLLQGVLPKPRTRKR